MKEMNALVYPVSFVPADVVKLLSPLFDMVELILPSDLNLAKTENLLGEYGNRVKLNAFATGEPDQEGRYRAIIKDFKSWAAQIGLGIGTTASALYESVQSGVPQDIQAITQAIKGRSEEDPLLEARIFLEFALEYDLEQQELERELRDISKKAERIETIMAGPEKELEGQQYGVTPHAMEPFYRRTTQVKRRLEAWYNLYVARADEISPSAMPLGIGIEVKDNIDKAYEAVMDKEPALEIARLDIAGLSSLDEEQIKRVKAAVGWITGQLSGEPDDASFKEIKQEAASLEELLPAKDLSPCLALTHYPAAKWADLLAESVKHGTRGTSGPVQANWSFYLY